jgi:hypothetical protein
MALALAAFAWVPSTASAQSGERLDLTETQMDELVRRSYQYISMFNVNQKGALDPDDRQVEERQNG